MQGINFGMFNLQMSRENLRATQIMLEKVETLRVCNWDQLITPGYLPTNFTAYYYETANTNSERCIAARFPSAPPPWA